jgi:hypothetical protein
MCGVVLVLFLVLLCHVSWCVMCMCCLVVFLPLPIFPLCLSLSSISLSLHALLALYLLPLISIPSPVSFFFVLSCFVMLHVLSLSFLSLLYSILSINSIWANPFFLSSLFSLLTLYSLFNCLVVSLCCLVLFGLSLFRDRLSFSPSLLFLVYLLLLASLLSRTISLFSLLDSLSFSLSVTTVSRVFTLYCLVLCVLSLYSLSFSLLPLISSCLFYILFLRLSLFFSLLPLSPSLSYLPPPSSILPYLLSLSSLYSLCLLLTPFSLFM